MKTIAPELLEEVTQRLVAEFHPEQIILFGSYAWGEPTKDSDLDLLVVVSYSNERRTQRARRALDCVEDIMAPMDVMVRTREEVERRSAVPASLMGQIVRRGRRLYG